MTYNPDQLSEYDDDWTAAPDPESSMEQVPRGKYQCYVARAEITHPEWSDHPRLELECRIMSGDYQGRPLWPSGSFDPQYIRYLKALIVRLGLGDLVKSASDVARALPDMLDRVVEVAVVPRKSDASRVNYYINGCSGKLDESECTSTPTTTDDMPF